MRCFRFLSAYMGHARFEDTAYYIHMIPDFYQRTGTIDTAAYESLLPEVYDENKDEQFFRTIRSFFEIYLVKTGAAAPIQSSSYKDALNLYLDFLEAEKGIPAAKTNWNCFNRQFVQEFLIWLEETRGCSKQTQQQRLAAIRSFIQYGGILDVCTVAIQADVEKIKFRKPPQKLVHWLTKEELAAFLSQPDGSKRTGLRDMVFLTVMYDTAARCQELIDLKSRTCV